MERRGQSCLFLYPPLECVEMGTVDWGIFSSLLALILGMRINSYLITCGFLCQVRHSSMVLSSSCNQHQTQTLRDPDPAAGKKCSYVLIGQFQKGFKFISGMLRGYWQFLKLKEEKGTEFWLGSWEGFFVFFQFSLSVSQQSLFCSSLSIPLWSDALLLCCIQTVRCIWAKQQTSLLPNTVCLRQRRDFVLFVTLWNLR